MELIYRNAGTISGHSQKAALDFEEEEPNIRAALMREFAKIGGEKRATGVDCLHEHWGPRSSLEINIEELEERMQQVEARDQESSRSSIKSVNSCGAPVSRPVSPLLKLLIYTATVFFLMRNVGDCSRMVRLGLLFARRGGCLLARANLLRLNGCLALLKNEKKQAFENFEEAQGLFAGAGCSLGRAICEAALGFIQFSQREFHACKEVLESALAVY